MLRRLGAVVFAAVIVAMLVLTFRPATGGVEAAEFCAHPRVIVQLPKICLPLV
jgi:hypothetical protein